ncbi:hypothetical protein [Silvanigrella sp.]|jgi:hypothetical protein|uniref:hypothetical protein n=1 Tax=Silvanigrella sp. TaxID=2024976 RepID=UPI0037CB1A35
MQVQQLKNQMQTKPKEKQKSNNASKNKKPIKDNNINNGDKGNKDNKDNNNKPKVRLAQLPSLTGKLNLNQLIKKYKSTQSPLLPKVTRQVIDENLTTQLPVKNIIRDLQCIWPIQFVLLLDNPKQAGGRWGEIFCYALHDIGLENILKNSNNGSIYNFVMKDNFDVFKKMKDKIHEREVKDWEMRVNRRNKYLQIQEKIEAKKASKLAAMEAKKQIEPTQEELKIQFENDMQSKVEVQAKNEKISETLF